MQTHEDAVKLLRQAAQLIQQADKHIKAAGGGWERADWEAVLQEVVDVDNAYDGLVREFGRRYLSRVTGKRIGSARDAILAYLKLKLGTPVTKEELRVVAGIDEWPRRVRELRVEAGWPIVVTPGIHSTYRLSDIRPDPSSKKLWQELNGIRRMDVSSQDRMLHLLRKRRGMPVHVEHLEYVANIPTWQDELLSLRSDGGWRLSAAADRPDLEDEYLLESDDPLPDEDEWDIPAHLRAQTLEADNRRCTSCGWEQDSSDDRWLEVHRRSPGSDLSDFASLCSACHDKFHRVGRQAVPIRLNRGASVRAADWHAYFAKEVPQVVNLHEAGAVIQRLLLSPIRIAGEDLPHIREVNGLRENQLWHARVSRVVELLERRFGPVWPDVIGKAVRPPLQGKAGDGLEQLLKYLIRQLTRREAETHMPLVRLFPGHTFPDAKLIDVYVPPSRQPEVFLSLKWSLRGDRTHQVHLEARTLAGIRPGIHFAVVTNEYDITRLRPLLDDPNIRGVYHVDKAGVEAMWKPEPEGLLQLRGLRDISELFAELDAV